MASWLGQYCINVSDLERTVKFYEALGLTCTSRTEIPQAFEAIMENADGKGGKIQLAQQKDHDGPIDFANAFWKLYISTNDIDRLHKAALEFPGVEETRPPTQMPNSPMEVSFLTDRDGYVVELQHRHPWRDGDSTTLSWVGQYCVYVSDIEATQKFWETLGLTKTSEIDIPNIKECILENPDQGGKIQLAQKLNDDSPIAMGTAMWKLYVWCDDAKALYETATAAGYTSVVEPLLLERWDTTMAFVADPDGYQVELVSKGASA